MSLSYDPHMRWNNKNMRAPSVMSHPSNTESLNYFNRQYLGFSSDPRNVRLGLCVDGFPLFINIVAPYFYWLIFLILHNLFPGIYMISS